MNERRAEFTKDKKRDPRRPTHSLVRHVCWCGWSTRATNRSLYGDPNSLDLALMAHRLDHLEGRVKADE